MRPVGAMALSAGSGARRLRIRIGSVTLGSLEHFGHIADRASLGPAVVHEQREGQIPPLTLALGSPPPTVGEAP